MDSKQFDELVARLASAATRRGAVKGVLGGALASVGVTSVASSQGKGKGPKEGKGPRQGKGPKQGKGRKKDKKVKCKGKGKDKVEVCHKGRETITVSRCAYERGHRKHGDTLGPCPYGG